MPLISNRQSKTEKAFTLIELLVVIAIVGILAGLAVVSMSGATEAARIAKLKVYSNSIRSSLMGNRVSEWKFDEVSGSAATDTVGTNNGTLVNSPTRKSGADCVSGGCLSFNGGNYATVENDDLDITEELTIEAWVKFNNFSGPPYIFSRGIASTDGWYWRIQTDGNWNAAYCWSGGSSYPYPNPAIILETGKWTHLVTVFNNTSRRIDYYKNGEHAGYSLPTQSFIGNPARALFIGGYNGSYLLNGSMDEVRIYSAALTASAIRDQYVAGLDKLLAKGQITNEDYQQRIASLNLTYATDK
jgi:prepilin-type N-terminal cleavage/methylation domain-containing protein